MGLAAFWGAVGASTLLVGALLAYHLDPSRRVIAVVMALGSGVLIGSVTFELIAEALETRTVAEISIFVILGALTFTLGDWLLTRGGGGERKDAAGAQAEGSPLAIVLGTVLDGVPESFVLGLSVLQGAVSPALLTGLLLSNLPEGMSSSSGLKAAGWRERRVVLMWTAVIAVSAVSAAAGYVLLDPETGLTGAVAQAFAAGALLAMLTDTMLPEAYRVEGVLTGTLVVIGLAIALGVSAI